MTTLSFYSPTVLLKSISVFLFIFSLNAFGQTSEKHGKWTLQECVQYALENNIQINQSALDLEDAKIDKSDALGNYLPNISGQASNTWNSGLTQNVTTGILQEQTTRNFSIGATATVPIFHGLRNLKEWQRAKLSRLANRYSLEKMKDDIMLNVANAYLEVLVNKEQVEVLEAQNELTQKQLSRTKTKIAAGAAPAGDSLEIKATDADEQQQIVTAKNDVQISLINLAQILQIDDYKDFNIAETSTEVPIETMLSKTPEEIIEKAKGNRYEVKVAEKDLELAEKDVEIAKSEFYPSLDGIVNFNTRETGGDRAIQDGIDPDNPTTVIGQVEATGNDVVAPNPLTRVIGPRPFFQQLSRNKGWTFGFQLNIPILNGFSTRNSVKRQKIAVKRSRNNLKQTKLDLESNVYQAYVDAQGAAKKYRAAQVSVTSRQKAFQYSKDRYDVGKITAYEFSQAKFDLSDAESKLVNAKYDYIFKLKVLDLYFGIPADQLTL